MELLLIFLCGIVALTHGQFDAAVPQLTLPPVRVATPDVKLPFQLSRPGLRGLRVRVKPPKLPIPEPARINVNIEDVLDNEWNAFRASFDKIYTTAEEALFRKEIFIENRAKVDRFNQEYAQGIRGFVTQLNPFADLLHHEFNSLLNGFNQSSVESTVPVGPTVTYIPAANVNVPENVDWRQEGAVGPVKYQEQCAGCWAFAAAGALEGQHFRKTGDLPDISVQNLIDCAHPQGNNGCNGGKMNPAYQYVKDNNGIDSEPSYPFEAKTEQCRFREEEVVAYCTGYVTLPSGNEKALEQAVATIGPISAAMDAGKESFQFYKEGIYDEPSCSNKPSGVNHAVLIVGYGVEPDGRKYWLIKNSYGPQWGIGGYLKLAKDNNNQCGIAILASYPLV